MEKHLLKLWRENYYGTNIISRLWPTNIGKNQFNVDFYTGMNYALKLYQEGEMTVKQICEITNISRASIYRKLLEIKGLESF